MERKMDSLSGAPQYFAKCLAAMEDLLVAELDELGAVNVERVRRGARFEADMEVLMRICIASRHALRVLRPVCAFEASGPDDLHAQAQTWDWSSVLTPRSSFAIDATVHSEHFTHSQFAMLRLKDAIVDHFRGVDTGARPTVDRTSPDVRIHLHISHNEVTISLDAAGEPLSRRGYRPDGAQAPLNECLAAGLLGLAGWEPGITLYDPMCGSGTFTAEAALWASGWPVNWHRRKFAFMFWRGFDEDLWWHVRDEFKARRNPVATRIYSSDRDFGAISKTRTSLSNMELDGAAELGRADFMKLEPRSEEGIVVLNPPYGERMKSDDIVEFYTAIGDRLKFHWQGFQAWVISSDLEALKHVGLRPHKRYTVFNGSLECRWAGFEVRKD
jgi:putative N6-adenine-specific DNA methylase